MVFNSLEYIVFFPLLVFFYFLTPGKYRFLLLLVSSYSLYYYWNNWYVFLIVFSTLVDYFASILIAQSDEKKVKRRYLLISIVLNLALLSFFKYFNFFSREFADLASLFGYSLNPIQHNLPLPLGISFYTFQTISYTIDVYKGRIPAERHIGKYALYVTFFPQLAAGPIERAGRLIPQFYGRYSFDYQRVVEGLQLILWGFFKKLVIADRMGLYVREVYYNPGEHYGLTVIIATIFFVFQIFCDFSAYSDIAIGSARILGIRLSKNFGHRPYFSKSFQEFWEKWHITLTLWIRDYLYMPLARRYRKKVPAGYLIIFVFLLMGFWHGANWTFVVWGGLHGIYLAVEGWLHRKGLPSEDQMKKPLWQLGGVATVYFLGLFAIVFFAAPSLGAAFQLLQHAATPRLGEIFLLGEVSFALSLGLLLFLEFMHHLMKEKQIYEYLAEQSTGVRWTLYLLLTYAILFLGVSEQEAFIYFEF
jgi:alginate O-acetyltransferase complex protein AlgI